MAYEWREYELLQKMEAVRKELNCLVASFDYNLQHPDVLAKSRQLDSYILRFQQNRPLYEKHL